MPRKPLPQIIIERPRCPHCKATAIKVRRSTPQGDGSQLRYYACRICGKTFTAVLE